MTEEANSTAKKNFREAQGLFNNHKFQEAIAIFSRLLDNDPANAAYLFNRGKCWQALNLFNFALWDLNDAYELYEDEHDQKKCKREIELTEEMLVKFLQEPKEVQAKTKDLLPKDFTPLFDKAIFLHLFYNYTKLNPNIPTNAHIEDLPRIKIRQLCQKSDLRPDLSPSYKLNDLIHLTRDLDHISLVVNFNNTKSQITTNEFIKFNQINGEHAAEDLIEMLRKGITPPTRASMKQDLLKRFEQIGKIKIKLTKEKLAEKIQQILDAVPTKYAFTRFKLYSLLERLR